MPDSAVLSVRGLRTEFHLEDTVIQAVDGLSYDLHVGRTLAMVGESGSGKSVHALSILKLLPAQQARITGGEILFHGKDLLKMNSEEMRSIRGNRIAMIFQEPMTSLNPVLTIGDQIAEAAITHQKLSAKAAMDKAVTLLQKVSIPNAEKRIYDYPHQFSGGMRQRVMIAMALACDPEILIADEPTTALDVTIQAQILDLIKNLQAEMKMAVILITHNIGVVAGMADDVIIMYAGRAVEHAPVSEIFKQPKHPYTRGLLNSIPSIYERKERLDAITGHPPEPSEHFAGCPFAPRCPDRMDRCTASDPLDYDLSVTHRVNCFLYESKAAHSRHRYNEDVLR